MYRLGYHNNNCIGCVKGGMGYWNKIRRDFPETFARMAAIERDVNATCLKDDNGQVFLDELDPERGKDEGPIVPECGLFCDLEFQRLLDPRVKLIMTNQLSITDCKLPTTKVADILANNEGNTLSPSTKWNRLTRVRHNNSFFV